MRSLRHQEVSRPHHGLFSIHINVRSPHLISQRIPLLPFKVPFPITLSTNCNPTTTNLVLSKTSRAQPHHRTPHQTCWTPTGPLDSFQTFLPFPLYLLTPFHVIFRLRLPPDLHSIPPYHFVYPSTLLTYSLPVLHLPCYSRLRPDLLFGPAPLVYKSALLYSSSI